MAQFRPALFLLLFILVLQLISAAPTDFHGQDRHQHGNEIEVGSENDGEIALSEWEMNQNVVIGDEYWSNPNQRALEAGKVEGDMNIGNLKAFIAEVNDMHGYGKNAKRNMRWETNIIPVILSTQYGEERSQKRQIIVAAMKEIMKHTCIQFVPHTNQTDFVYIVPKRGCYSYVGRQGGQQELSLEYNCLFVGTVMHELLHVLGFVHEHSRPERDEYIRIHFDNVLESDKGNFEKYAIKDLEHLEEGYDYESIMHYSSRAFSKDGYSKTIEALQPGGESIGQRAKLSAKDIREINKLYNCVTTSGPATNGAGGGGPQITRPCRDVNWRCSFWVLDVDTCNADLSKVCPKSCRVCS